MQTLAAAGHRPMARGARGVIFFEMALFSGSLASSWRALARFAALVLAAGAAGCAQRLVEPSVADAEEGGRLLELPPREFASYGAEVLHARLEVLGLDLASLETTLCPAGAQGALALTTRVTPAALVRAVRRTGGDARTELSSLSPAPHESEYNFREGDLLRRYRVAYAPGGYEYVYDNGGPGHRAGQAEVPEGAHPHDMQSAMLLLRSWRPRLEERAYFYAVLGRRLWRVDVVAKGPEVIGTDAGPQLTHRIDGLAVRLWQPEDAARKNFSLWLSEGPERAPLRLMADASFGEVTLRLMQRGTSPNCREAERAAVGPAPPRARPPERSLWSRPRSERRLPPAH